MGSRSGRAAPCQLTGESENVAAPQARTPGFFSGRASEGTLSGLDYYKANSPGSDRAACSDGGGSIAIGCVAISASPAVPSPRHRPWRHRLRRSCTAPARRQPSRRNNRRRRQCPARSKMGVGCFCVCGGARVWCWQGLRLGAKTRARPREARWRRRWSAGALHYCKPCMSMSK